MPELEHQLHALAQEVEFPPAPDLAWAVAARLREPRSARPPLGRALALAAIWSLATAGVVVAAARPAADALLNASLSGVTIERTNEPPPTPTVRDLNLGGRADATGVAGLPFTPLAPAIPGGPSAVGVRNHAELNLVYAPRPGLPPTRTTGAGLLVTEFRGDLAPEYLGKILPQATSVERLEIRGAPAAFISGAPHFFFFRGPDGGVTESDLQIAQNVILVQVGNVLVRMEGAFDRDTAVRLAGTLRPLGL